MHLHLRIQIENHEHADGRPNKLGGDEWRNGAGRDAGEGIAEHSSDGDGRVGEGCGCGRPYMRLARQAPKIAPTV